MKILTIENLKKKERNGKWVVLMWQPQAEKTVPLRLEISSLVSWQFLGIFWLSHVFVKFPLFICHRGLYWIVLPWPTFVCNKYIFSPERSQIVLYFQISYFTTSALFSGVSLLTITVINVDRLLALTLNSCVEGSPVLASQIPPLELPSHMLKTRLVIMPGAILHQNLVSVVYLMITKVTCSHCQWIIKVK